MAYVLATRWSFSRAPLILQQWNPKMRLGDMKPEKVVVWVRFGLMEMEFWSTKILSKLASYIGVPQQSDLLTVTQGRLGFARVLVEVEVNGDLPESVPLISTRYGNSLIPVTYEWYPVQCPNYSRWGHRVNDCPKLASPVMVQNVQEEGLEVIEKAEEVNVVEKGEEGDVIAGCDESSVVRKGAVDHRKAVTDSQGTGALTDRQKSGINTDHMRRGSVIATAQKCWGTHFWVFNYNITPID